MPGESPFLSHVYHYCPASYVSRIVDAGVLRPSSAGGSTRERPTLWFTFRPTYEPTALKVYGRTRELTKQLSLHEQYKLLGLARFVAPADLAPLTWREWVRTSGVRGVEATRMVRAARRLGSDPSLYRATYDAVALGACVGVEVWDGEGWGQTSSYS